MSRVEHGATLNYWSALHEIADTLAGIMCLTQTLRYVVDQSRREADRQRQQHTGQTSEKVSASSRTHGVFAGLNLAVAATSVLAPEQVVRFIELASKALQPLNESAQQNLNSQLDFARVEQQIKMMLQQNADNQSGQMDKAAEVLAQLLRELSRGA